ncbi:hypothetical protein BH18ACT2_BH18ACT2_11870 [soil metagenome]
MSWVARQGGHLRRLERWPTPALAPLAWAPMLLWFAAFRPGIMSADSLSSWQQVVDGDWVDAHPPVYTAAMWLSERTAGSPLLLTLAQSYLLAFAIVSVARAAVRVGARRPLVIAITAIVACTPMVGAFSVSLWKDVPFTAAFLLLGARLIDLAAARIEQDRRAQLLAARGILGWSLAATVLRQNGVLVVALALIVMAVTLRGLRRAVVSCLVLCVLTLAGLRVVVYPLLGVAEGPPNAEISTMLHDIAAIAVRDPAALDSEDVELLERVAPLAAWTTEWQRWGCSSANWQFAPVFRGWSAVEGAQASFVRVWAELAVSQPRAVLGNRLCVGSVGWRPDSVGRFFTVDRGIPPNPYGLMTDPMVGPLNDAGRTVLELFDRPWIQWLAWRAPLWIAAAYGLVGITAWRRRQPLVALPLLLLVSLQVAITAFNVSQDARYMMPGLLLAVLLLPLSTVHVRGNHATPKGPESVVPERREARRRLG